MGKITCEVKSVGVRIIDVGNRGAEVNNFEISLFVNFNVAVFEVAVNDLDDVKEMNGLSELFCYFEVIFLILEGILIILRVDKFAFGDILSVLGKI